MLYSFQQLKVCPISNCDFKIDLLDKYLSGYVPYISKLTYNLEVREVVFVFQKRKVDELSLMRLKFTDVLSFREETFEDAFDDNLTDSIMGMHLVSEGLYCVNTEKRELLIRVAVEPKSELIPASK